jgi:type I restriction enzyme M protein
MKHTERFHWGWAPEGGKKADLMFLQHMVAVLKTDGIAATVMPHGVLFRGGAERDIRTKLLNDDVIDAVIGLAPNLFYGTGIPACVLVLRAPRSKPPQRRGKILFINADREFSAGRAQNYLLPEHYEKIVAAYREFADIPGYARVVTREELRENEDNLNIRRYADNGVPRTLKEGSV